MRINKYFAAAGVCSRRQADQLIEAGRVTINSRTACMGDQAGDSDEVRLDGRVIRPEEEHIILAYNKPVGVVCTTSEKEKNNIVDAVGFEKRIYPVGRLDKDSSGLILLTNMGELSDSLLRARNYHEKEYVVAVDHAITGEFLDNMRSGVQLSEARTRECEVKKLSSNRFSIVLTQGLNRQIRRMCEALGYRVRSLKRVRIENILLGDLTEGSYRRLTEEERLELLRRTGVEE